MCPAIASPLRSRTTPATSVTQRRDAEHRRRPGGADPLGAGRSAPFCSAVCPRGLLLAVRGARRTRARAATVPGPLEQEQPDHPQHGDQQRRRGDPPEGDQAGGQLGAGDDDGQHARRPAHPPARGPARRPGRSAAARRAPRRRPAPRGRRSGSRCRRGCCPPRRRGCPDSAALAVIAISGRLVAIASRISPPSAEPEVQAGGEHVGLVGQLDAGDPDDAPPRRGR